MAEMLSELNMDYITNLITQQDSANSSLPTKYINCVPKIQTHPYKTITYSGNNHIFILLDSDDKDLSIKENMISTNSGLLSLQKQHKIFYVNEQNLSNLINEIIQTTGKYVYPMVFVNYLKQTLKINEKVNFDNTLLLNLRIWANQIRELSSRYSIDQYNCSDSTQAHEHITYIGYKICCELLYYYKYTHNK